MAKGIFLGILLQCISATGYLVIVNVTSITSEWFRTALMICISGVVALVVLGITVISGRQQLSSIQPKEYIVIAIGSIMIMFVAQVIYFFGVKASNMTVMSLTMLAFPFISLIWELVLGRVKLSSLGIHELAGFVLVVAGYVIFVTKPMPQ